MGIAQLDHDDLRHLESFSGARRADVMRKIMSYPPAHTVVLDGSNDFEKTVLKLRRDGFGLIDLQPQETACATIWYRRKSGLLRRTSEDVAMLVWEAQESGEETTVITWQV